jgi:transcription initiation factor TFIID subunit 12
MAVIQPNATNIEAERAKLRAQQMQAAARAAAGLPPLDKLTATSVTTVPPPITPSKIGRPAASSAATVSHIPPAVQDTRQQQQLQQQQRKATLSRQQTGSGGRGRYAAAGAPTPSRTPKQSEPPAPQARPTPKPTAQEGRLSLTAVKSNATGAAHMAPLVGQRIQDLVKSIDPNYVIDTEAEEQVLQLADDFLDKVTRQSLRLAQHRGSKTLDVQDVQIVLAKHWGIAVPGLGLPNIRPLKPGKQTVLKATPSSGGGVAGVQSSKRKGSDSSTPGAGSSRKKANTAASSMPTTIQASN